ncbi:hypothetical protein [Chromobacterium violaceum]|uniref:hypothetical protein n=1 Tax=Chromobacterium violaceum TaxID=536 RepID=UPI00111C7FD5|nr:hypothetical protein [Chromobacterium violaceum]MCD0491692.1 hypothetical protein [Chromobacterium violaceum]QIY79522.1 hypothetical protein FOB43_10100 [Chromobacterium violaceum]QRO31695.1 hypothetical protein I6K04_14400 [Chromobacterium violaceum]QRQ18505.1 hypothetical protein I6K03_08330 [Chromobacterium violaceum]
MKYKIQILLPIALAVFSSTPRAASITVETSSDLKKNESTYRKKYIDPKGVYAKAKIFSIATWNTGQKKGALFFLQLHGQCRVVNFSTPTSDSDDGILLDSPWCKFKTSPIVKESTEFSIIKYTIQIKADTTTEEIRLNKNTGELCSNSFGNTNLQCQ